jgi:hypothetical protein
LQADFLARGEVSPVCGGESERWERVAGKADGSK